MSLFDTARRRWRLLDPYEEAALVAIGIAVLYALAAGVLTVVLDL